MCGALLTACSPPMNAGRGVARDIAADLGPATGPVPSGIYRLATLRDRKGVTKTFRDLIMDGDRPPEFSEYMTVQWDPRSQTYGSSVGNIAFLAGRDPYLTMQVITLEDEAYYFPVRIVDRGQGLRVVAYTCDSLPDGFKSAQRIEDDCRVRHSDTLRAGFRTLDPAAEAEVFIEYVSPLPDMGG